MIKHVTNTKVICIEPDVNPASVLVIDDNATLRSMLVESLADHGYDDIDTAVDGNDCIIKALEKTYDVIILDLIIPKRIGLEVLDIIKRIDSKLPVIIISGAVYGAEFNLAKKS